MNCPRCATGFLFTSYNETKCLQCGHRPPTFTPNPRPVLAELRCSLCQRDRERGSELCRQCTRKSLKQKPLARPRLTNGQCRRGHAFTQENLRFYMNNGRRERRCALCEQAKRKAHRNRKKGVAA